MENIYQKLWQENHPKISVGDIETDFQINNENDYRRGLTLRFRPPVFILENIQTFLQLAKEFEPRQYFYPASDIHLTILTIISCHPNFDLNQIIVSDYLNIVQNSINKIKPFELTFQGITATPNAIIVQGFDQSEHINVLRNALRLNFKITDLFQTIDHRYKLETAHLTVIRFKDKLENPTHFADFLQASRNIDFGKCRVGNVELVFNDWYQRKEKTRVVEKFRT